MLPFRPPLAPRRYHPFRVPRRHWRRQVVRQAARRHVRAVSENAHVAAHAWAGGRRRKVRSGARSQQQHIVMRWKKQRPFRVLLDDALTQLWFQQSMGAADSGLCDEQCAPDCEQRKRGSAARTFGPPPSRQRLACCALLFPQNKVELTLSRSVPLSPPIVDPPDKQGRREPCGQHTHARHRRQAITHVQLVDIPQDTQAASPGWWGGWLR